MTIISPYMDNIDRRVLDAQRSVFEHFGHEIVQYKTEQSHADTLDYLMDTLTDDVVAFFDIDCIPLNTDIIAQAYELAKRGILVGNAQSSSHIDNGNHAFVAPSFMALSRKLWAEIGFPSFRTTPRSDVGQEITYAAQSHGTEIQMLMPVHFESSPVPVGLPDGRVSNPVCWQVNKHLYGLNSTFTLTGRSLDTFHSFQSSHQQTERFIAKCGDVVKGIIKFG